MQKLNFRSILKKKNPNKIRFKIKIQNFGNWSHFDTVLF